MFGRTKCGSTVSTLVLVLALVLTVFLPDLVAGKPDAAGPAHVSATRSPGSAPPPATPTSPPARTALRAAPDRTW